MIVLRGEGSSRPASLAIATAPAAESLASETLPWLGFFAGVAIVAWLIAHWLRRALRRETKGPLGGFAAEELERMHREGELTEAQFRAIKRASAIAAARPAGSGPETPVPGPGTNRDRREGDNGSHAS